VGSCADKAWQRPFGFWYGQLFATGATVELDVRPATAGLDSELFLRSEDGSRGPTLALNTDVGRHIEIGPFPAGRELVFGIFVRRHASSMRR
jgi:hypothetical protein